MKKYILLILAVSLQAEAMNINEYMSNVMKKNKLLVSYSESVEASKEKQTAGDIGLSPVLTAAYSLTSDKSEPLTLAEKRDTTVASIGLAKKFSSGTSLSLTGETYKYQYFNPVTIGNDGYSRGGLSAGITQSLWKDFFGSATRLRQAREETTNKLETYALDLKNKASLVEFESDFWDYFVASENIKVKKANFDRAKKLESWTASRVFNGISDQSDLLQVKALASLRELELSTVTDELKTKETKIRENLDLTATDELPVLSEAVANEKSYMADLIKKNEVIKIDSYLAILESDVKKTVSEEVVDGLRPDLALTGKYSTSSYNLDNTEMLNNISKTNKPITYLGLTFSWVFGSDAKSAQLNSAKKEALASSLKAEQAKISGLNAWKEHLRKYELTKKNVITLEKIAKLQSDRTKAEQIKFSKGRTITSSVVSAETDSAEAEVNYLKAKSALRKLEAATQLFVAIEE